MIKTFILEFPANQTIKAPIFQKLYIYSYFKLHVEP